jgi:Glycosyltransferase family 9 (heptosyltransferase)
MNILSMLWWRVRIPLGAISAILPQEARSPTRVLCIVSGGVGDKLMALPAVRLLRRSFPDAHFVLQFIGSAAPFSENEAEEVVHFGPEEFGRRLFFAAGGFDVVFVNSVGVFDLWNEVCALVSRAGIRMGPRYRHVPCKQTVYNRSYIYGSDHETVVNWLGAGGAASAIGPLAYPLARDFLPRCGRRGRVIGLHVGSQVGAEMKRWPIHYYRELIQLLSSNDLRFLLIGSEHERPIMEEACIGMQRVDIQDCSSTDRFVDAILQCDLVIGNDSGICHLSAALGLPVVTIMAATDPAKCAPVANFGEVISVPCEHGFCYWSGRPCIRCIDMIPPARVAASAPVARLLDIVRVSNTKSDVIGKFATDSAG